MDLRLLQYFLVVASAGSVTGAAKELHISQPTLSRQIAALEADLGVQLFVRGNRCVALTAEGALLKERAAELLTLADKTRSELQSEKDTVAGDICIGAVEIGAFDVIARAMSRFCEAHPRVRFKLYSDNSRKVRDNVDSGLIDAGFIRGPVDLDGYGFHRIAISERWGVLMSLGHPLAEKECVCEEDLLTQRLIFPSGLIEDRLAAQWFSNFEKLRLAATFNLIVNAMSLVKQGLGIAICMEREPFFNDRGLRFVPLTPVREEKEAFLIWKKRHLVAKAPQYFLRELCGEDYDG